MLGSISPVNSGLSGTGAAPARIPDVSAGRSAAPAETSSPFATTQGASTQLAGTTQLLSAVAELLRNVGGDLQNDKMLQMLVALVILIALLHGTQGPESSERSAFDKLGSSTGAASANAGLFASSTMFTFEQTTTTISLYTAETYATGFDGATTASGGNIDIST